jgi:two-component system nitrogen regulation response regulator GlnG
MAEILIVDDDQSIATAFERFLKHEGHVCTLASNAEEAVRLVGERDPDLVVMDIRMPGVDGLQALQQLRSLYPDVYVVMMTAYGTSQTSIDAIRAGAFEYLTKPLDLDQLRTVIGQAMAAKRSRDQAAPADKEKGPVPRVALVGETPAMQDVYKMIGRLATHDVPALVLGERGTGKELVVATIHDNSNRRDRPFVGVDCSALPEDALEAELFAGDAGTLHLASVHALPKPLQARLARAMSDERSRVSTRKPLNARVIASTDQDLTEAVDADVFSRELYEALAVITLRLPPLRDRRDDIAILVRHFIQRFDEELDRRIKGIDEQVLRRLQEHAWPGNVGELESVIKRACIVTRSDVITLEDIGESISDSRFPGRQDLESALSRSVRVALQERIAERAAGTTSSAFHDIVDLVEATLVREALTITNGNQVKASELLGVNRATLRKKTTSES